MNWMVAQTESQREHIAVRHLARIGFETYFPQIKNRKKRIEPLFPGYLFVLADINWPKIRATIGIIRVLMSCERPAQIDPKIIAEIKAREKNGLVHLPKPRKGQKVRIIRGSFADQIGIYEGQNGKDRERVLLAMLGRMVTVELKHADLVFVPSGQ
jgi:transcriptional antiterminator RfaH